MAAPVEVNDIISALRSGSKDEDVIGAWNAQARGEDGTIFLREIAVGDQVLVVGERRYSKTPFERLHARSPFPPHIVTAVDELSMLLRAGQPNVSNVMNTIRALESVGPDGKWDSEYSEARRNGQVIKTSSSRQYSTTADVVLRAAYKLKRIKEQMSVLSWRMISEFLIQEREVSAIARRCRLHPYHVEAFISVALHDLADALGIADEELRGWG